jgi:hypothetical protein
MLGIKMLWYPRRSSTPGVRPNVKAATAPQPQRSNNSSARQPVAATCHSSPRFCDHAHRAHLRWRSRAPREWPLLARSCNERASPLGRTAVSARKNLRTRPPEGLKPRATGRQPNARVVAKTQQIASARRQLRHVRRNTAVGVTWHRAAIERQQAPAGRSRSASELPRGNQVRLEDRRRKSGASHAANSKSLSSRPAER